MPGSRVMKDKLRGQQVAKAGAPRMGANTKQPRPIPASRNESSGITPLATNKLMGRKGKSGRR